MPESIRQTFNGIENRKENIKEVYLVSSPILAVARRFPLWSVSQRGDPIEALKHTSRSPQEEVILQRLEFAIHFAVQSSATPASQVARSKRKIQEGNAKNEG